MQISAKRRPASSPPGTALPQSISRVPLGQRRDRDAQRVGVGGEAVRERARALVEREGHRVLQDQDLAAPQLEAVARPARVAARRSARR